MGRFADLVGYRTSLVIGTVLMVGSMFAASVSKTYWQFFLSQGVTFGLGLAFVYLPAVTISRHYFPASMHGKTNALVLSGAGLGGCVLPYMVKQLVQNRGLPQSFRF
ncbi:hypothetical protein MRB53_038598 [Persea americana]|nr:hypothetical protein MRB53_038598 [Persea americana]